MDTVQLLIERDLIIKELDKLKEDKAELLEALINMLDITEAMKTCNASVNAKAIIEKMEGK